MRPHKAIWIVLCWLIVASGCNDMDAPHESTAKSLLPKNTWHAGVPKNRKPLIQYSDIPIFVKAETSIRNILTTVRSHPDLDRDRPIVAIALVDMRNQEPLSSNPQRWDRRLQIIALVPVHTSSPSPQSGPCGGTSIIYYGRDLDLRAPMKKIKDLLWDWNYPEGTDENMIRTCYSGVNTLLIASSLLVIQQDDQVIVRTYENLSWQEIQLGTYNKVTDTSLPALGWLCNKLFNSPYRQSIHKEMLAEDRMFWWLSSLWLEDENGQPVSIYSDLFKDGVSESDGL